jgi:ribosome-binding protein aMBF1 (putative translation factor)
MGTHLAISIYWHFIDRIYPVVRIRLNLQSRFMKQERRVLKTLGKNIRKVRLARRMSQMYLAAEAGLDKSYIGAIERAEVNPSIKKIVQIADALGISCGQLFDGL